MRRSSSLALRRYSTEPRTRKYVKEYGFLSFARKYKKQLLDTGADSLKTASKKVVHKTGEFLGKKTAEAVTKSNDNKIVKPEENPRNVKDESQVLKKRKLVKIMILKAYLWKDMIIVCCQKMKKSRLIMKNGLIKKNM